MVELREVCLLVAFLNYVGDSREGITGHYTENAWLTSIGGGIGGYWGDVRSDGTSTSGGSQSTGSIPFYTLLIVKLWPSHKVKLEEVVMQPIWMYHTLKY